MSPQPDAAAPPDAAITADAAATSTDLTADAAAPLRAPTPLSAYVHVPFCATRCGYCDFNTYTAAELGSAPGASRQAYLDAVGREVDFAAAEVADGGVRPLDTVFFGGGTPTLLPPAELGSLLARLRDAFGLAPGAEVTTEANPDSVTPESLAALVEAGFTRISFGMQSSVPHVLATLERTHTPGRAIEAVAWARAAGFASVSLDLIYGTPGESVADWRASVEAAIAAQPDHVSAYSLIVEEGTRFAARVRRGELPLPDDDDLATKYELADDLLAEAGYAWYEVSNWARPGHECRHNLAYWRSYDWWGFGPGAHSHVGGVRWWNAKHPRTYAERAASGSPSAGREVLTVAERAEERVLLEVRLAEGLGLDALTGAAASVAQVVADGLAEADAGRLVLTRRGRLLADAVVRTLLA